MLQEFTAVAHTYFTQFVYLLPRLIIAAIVLTAVWLSARRLRNYLATKLTAHSADPLLTNFLTEVGRWLLVLAGVLLALQIIGFSGVVGGLLGGLGLSAFLVGFAFKDIAENFLAGVILAFNRPFHVQDSIEVKGLKGKVLELNLRTTRIKTADGKDIYIPNSLILKEPVLNYTRDGQVRQDFALKVPANVEPEPLMQEILDQVRQESIVLDTSGFLPAAALEELSGTDLTLRIFFWTPADQPGPARDARTRLLQQARQLLQAHTPAADPAAPTEIRLLPDSAPLRVRNEAAE